MPKILYVSYVVVFDSLLEESISGTTWTMSPFMASRYHLSLKFCFLGNFQCKNSEECDSFPSKPIKCTQEVKVYPLNSHLLCLLWWQASEKNSGWEDMIFIPPGKGRSQHVKEVAEAWESLPRTLILHDSKMLANHIFVFTDPIRAVEHKSLSLSLSCSIGSNLIKVPQRDGNSTYDGSAWAKEWDPVI